ncbi:hypothetical protein SAMN05216570_2981 [Dyella sp. OK004]|uniref:hypothetical protein n=1 Tax=Dyella sp. OK004 TaxID=1855292 RepID=UPI0008E1947A|nr:hypothetical protein [Dyella sp. OK004]SFS13957.1 hypothetical protein SAMN05216570_2981 [Dyella sp. OK004]
MKLTYLTRTASLGVLAAALFANAPLHAQDSMPPAPASQDRATGQPVGPANRVGVMKVRDVDGRHTMQATVTATDPATGIVDVTTGGMALRVHFPPPAMAPLKAGDQITLYLGFTKP